MARIWLTALEPHVEADIRRLLQAEGHAVLSDREAPLHVADVVFCNGDDPTYRSTVARIRNSRPKLPVVVVTRLPDSGKWLDALEAGASDYCSAPFETIQLQWLLSAVLRMGAPIESPFDAVTV